MKKEHKLSWCLKQAKGLKLIKPNKNLMQVYLKKSRSALNMMNAAIKKDESEWILDTSYYAKYFAIYALFMEAGIKCEIHDCIISALKMFVEEKILPTEIQGELEYSKELRIGALYYNKEFGKEKIMKSANKTPAFCLEVEEITNKVTDDELEKVRQKLER